MINGQTGKVAGDKPLSSWRIGLAVGAGLIAIFIVFIALMVAGAFG